MRSSGARAALVRRQSGEHAGELEGGALRVEREALGAAGEGGGALPQPKRFGQCGAAAGAGFGGDPGRGAGEEGLVARLGGFEREALGERGAAGVDRVAAANQRVHCAVERLDLEAAPAGGAPGGAFRYLHEGGDFLGFGVGKRRFEG